MKSLLILFFSYLICSIEGGKVMVRILGVGEYCVVDVNRLNFGSI